MKKVPAALYRLAVFCLTKCATSASGSNWQTAICTLASQHSRRIPDTCSSVDGYPDRL